MKYHFVIHEEDDGYFTECVELKGCITQGDTIEDLELMAEDALNVYLEEPIDSKFPSHPLPDESLNNNHNNYLMVEVRSDVAFITLLRHYRHQHKLTQHQMREALGMKSRNTYVKLERQGNPTIKTLGKIVKAFPDFPVNAIFAT
ncbi:MAG: type II toxin-antitoxin system HicB family antitoxin [Spirochaetaceae bacterium]